MRFINKKKKNSNSYTNLQVKVGIEHACKVIGMVDPVKHFYLVEKWNQAVAQNIL